MALVTGASSGIGKSTAESMLKETYSVYVAALWIDGLQIQLLWRSDKGARAR